jgi:hypothetical protein
MKIILSRKGFDASAGGVASPILPDGTLLSLPIPQPGAAIRYADLQGPGVALGPLVEDLTRGRITRDAGAHLDPDLRASTYPRDPGWRPIFGQDSAAQSHLARHGVGPGDLFLFFGWFREVAYAAGRYRFRQGAPDRHVLFGWLQVGESVPVGQGGADVPAWARYHPHYDAPFGRTNTMYLARPTLALDGVPPTIPGAGVFARLRPALGLTAPDSRLRGVWRLPAWCAPRAGHFPFTYHPRPQSWQPQADHTRLRSAGRGQEFVLDTAHYPEAIGWARTLISGTTE